MQLNSFLQLLKVSPIVADILIGIFFLIVGFICSKLYDRFVTERFLNTLDLLKKLRNQKKLSSIGGKRLTEELRVSIYKLKNEFSKSRQQGTFSQSISEHQKYWNKNLNEDITITNCPPDKENEFFLFYDSENFSQDVIFQLKELALRVDEKFKKVLSDIDKILFENRHLINNEAKFYFWLNAENYFPESSMELSASYNFIAELLKNYLPGIQVVIELYIPADIKSINGVINNPLPTSDLIKAKNNFATQIINRERIFQEFRRGHVFGRLSYVHDPIPIEVIAERLSKLSELSSKDLISVYGSPGTGKSFISECFISKNSQAKHWYIVLNTTDQVNSFLQKVRLQTKESFLSSIVDLLCESTHNYLPTVCTINSISLQLTRYVLINLLRDESFGISIVIDDYYLYKDSLDGTVLAIIGKKWGLKFLIAGRPSCELVDKLGSKAVNYECKLWSRVEALQIINHWTGKTDSQINDVLTIEWLKKEQAFSIYLLRLVVKNIDNIERSSLTQILRKEILYSVAPVFNKLVGNKTKQRYSDNELRSALHKLISSGRSDTISLTRLREILEKENEIDIDIFINDIGQLCWACRFQVNNYGGEIKEHFIEKYLPYLDVNNFKKLGTDANIFKSDEGEGSLEWGDNLISEGCLSILLRRNLQQVDDDPIKQSEFSAMLEGLRVQNSLNILSLVLDSDAIIRMTKVIGTTSYDRIDIIDELLTEQNIDRLKNERKIESLATILIEAFSKNVDDKHVIKVSKLVKKLSDIDENYKNFIFQMVGHDLFVSKIARYVAALEFENDEKFYELMDDKGVDKFESTIISIIIWKKFRSQDFLVRIVDNERSIDDKKKEMLIKQIALKFSPSDALVEIEQLHQDLTFDETKINIRFLTLLFEAVKTGRSQLNDVKYRLQTILRRSWFLKKYKFCDLAVKFVVFFESEFLFHSEISWITSTNKKFSIPVLPMGPHRIVEIKGLIPQIDSLRIASSHQILENRPLFGFETIDALELVSDNLIGNDIHGKQLPNNFTLINFENNPIRSERALLEDLQRNSNRRFVWRPVYYFG